MALKLVLLYVSENEKMSSNLIVYVSSTLSPPFDAYLLACRETRRLTRMHDGQPDVREFDGVLQAGLQRRRRHQLRPGGESPKENSIWHFARKGKDSP